MIGKVIKTELLRPATCPACGAPTMERKYVVPVANAWWEFEAHKRGDGSVCAVGPVTRTA